MSDESLPRVSTILGTAAILPSRDFLPEHALQRGEAVHSYTEMYDRGILDESDVDPQVAPYLAAWKRFRRDSGVEILGIEERCESPIYRYRGRLDRRMMLNGVKGVGDIKCGGKFPWHRIQLAAYGMTLDPTYRGRWGIHLFPDESYKLESYTQRQDFDVWKACLTLYHFRVEEKLHEAAERSALGDFAHGEQDLVRFA